MEEEEEAGIRNWGNKLKLEKQKCSRSGSVLGNMLKILNFIQKNRKLLIGLITTSVFPRITLIS